MVLRQHSRYNNMNYSSSSWSNSAAAATVLIAALALHQANCAEAVSSNNGIAAAVIAGSSHNARQLSSSNSHHHSLLNRQYPSDAPACASLCIRVKIEEAANPGLAVSCDFRTSGYVQCLCQSTKFNEAYETCILDNCGQPSTLSQARSLFSSFCSAGSESQDVAAVSVASSAVASQASVAALSSSTATTSGASSGVSTTATTTSGETSGTTASTTSGATSGMTTSMTTSGGSNTGTRTTSGGTNTGSSSTLNSAQLESARANATGVSAASSRHSSLSTWTILASSSLVIAGSLVMLL